MTSRLGFYLQLSGAINVRKGNRDKGFDYYQRALVNYRATVGDHYYRTSQVCVKLAELYASRNEIEAARSVVYQILHIPLAKIVSSIYYDQALDNFSLHTFTKPELALTKHKKAKFMRDLGDTESAADLAEQAWQLYEELVPHAHVKSAAELQDGDFESTVPLILR